MALRDIKSTQERVSTLKNIKTLIDQCIKICVSTERYFKSENGTDNYGDFNLMWDGVKSRLTEAEALATLAKDELLDMINQYGFVFKYEWEIGKRGVTQFDIDGTLDEINIMRTSAVEDSAGLVVATGDRILITGTTSNDSIEIIAAGSAGNTLQGTDLTTEPCTTNGAKITLLTRGT